MKFNAASGSELQDQGFLDQVGKYQFLIDEVKVDMNIKDEIFDGTTLCLTVLGGTVPGQEHKKCNLTLWNIDPSKDITEQKQTIKRWTNFFLAANVLQPSQLGGEVECDPGKAAGHQVVINLQRRRKQENGKWVDDMESKFLEIAFSDIFHVDDPAVASIPMNKDALGMIAKEHRHSKEWFAYKDTGSKASKSGGEKTSDYTDVDEF